MRGHSMAEKVTQQIAVLLNGVVDRYYQILVRNILRKFSQRNNISVYILYMDEIAKKLYFLRK